MLLLYRNKRIASRLPDRNLHSTMLLLYLSEMWKQIPKLPAIYIPLCFYFIGCIICRSIYSQDLHSTMLLLYHIQEQRAEITAQNLHSTMLLLYRGRRFTRRCRKLEFTFHYASTLSTLRQLEAIASAHLHSTMLLLYLARNASDCVP